MGYTSRLRRQAVQHLKEWFPRHIAAYGTITFDAKKRWRRGPNIGSKKSVERKKGIKQKNMQALRDQRFPNCPQLQYYLGLKVLNLTVQMGCSVVTVVWSKDISLSHRLLNGQKQRKDKKKTESKEKHVDLQHRRFPHVPPLQYWLGPIVLKFAVRMGSGVVTVVLS